MNRLSDWSARPDSEQMRDDGRCQVDSIILPPLKVLQKRALAIAGGCLAKERFVGTWEDWWDLRKYNPGRIDIHAKWYTNVQGSAGLGYWIAFDECGDPEAHGHAGTFMSPEFAFAWMIAVAEDHHEAVLEELALETAAGLS